MTLHSIWLFIFIFAILYILRTTFRFVKGVFNESLDITKQELIFLALAFSYFITYIIG